jgi:threonine/homoserine/homoserine lactone efflux protein
MTIASLLALSAALAVFAAVPGPGTMSVVSCGLGRGFAVAAALVVGIVLGDLTYLLFALFGLDLIARNFNELFLIVRFGGAAYLIWMGVSLWRAPAVIPEPSANAPKGSILRTLLSGLAVSLGNPKVIAFYLGFLPAFVSLKDLSGGGIGAIAAATALVVGGVLLAYARLAATARRFLTSPRRIRALNRTAGTAMVGSGVALAVR